MSIEWLLERIASFGEPPALIGRDRRHTYQELADLILGWQRQLRDLEVRPGDVVALCGDYSPNLCSLLVALLTSGAIVVPLGSAAGTTSERLLDVARVGHIFSFGAEGDWTHRRRAVQAAPHPLLARLRRAGDPGLVVFTSGSTGESKGAVLSVGAVRDPCEIPALVEFTDQPLYSERFKKTRSMR
jgi:long-chain acyl-CoA synthetase